MNKIIGKNWFDAFVPRRLRDELKRNFKNLLKGNVKVMEYYENPVLTKSGKERLIAWHNTILKDEKGGVVASLSSGEDITERKRAEKDKEQIALIDSLTGLYNHRHLGDVIETEFHRAKRGVHSLSAIMIDIDYFKSINDVYGHAFGDMVLKQFARQLKGLVRKYDIVGRFGGEEFVVVSPGINRYKALLQAQRLLDALTFYNFGNKKQMVKIKLSMAVISYPDDNITRGTDFINLADKLLAKAKDDGGNRAYSLLDTKVKRKKAGENGWTKAENVRFLEKKIVDLTKRSNQSVMEAIFAFAKTIETKDHYTGEHVEKTVNYAVKIATALGLSQEEIEHIKQAAVLHVCRAVCRRAERSVVRLSRVQRINKECIAYLNRLSALFFGLALLANARAGVNEEEWKGSS